ncbi:MAG: hypothetical protein MI700_07195 [Balneolales bacterium]|nr:hypothetical protein [Balneolales bacterium]
MKTHLYKYLVTGLLAITFITTPAWAQTIDANRMNRDIRIMENILAELFRPTISATNSEGRAFVVSSDNSFRRRGIRGTYLTDYGIIFRVPAQTLFPGHLETATSLGYSFYYDAEVSSTDEDDDRSISEETVIERISEFLQDYGSTISQLQDHENILVIYDTPGNSRSIIYINQGRVNSEQSDVEPLPLISVSAKVKDLREYRSGRLSEEGFNERLSIDIDDSEEYMDIEILANILESAFENQPREGYRLSGGVSHLMLNNFGAIFTMNVRYTDEPGVRWRNNIALEFSRIQNGFDKEEEQEEYREYLEKVEQAFDTFKTNLSEYMVDYGRTLSSVSDDQHVLVTITLSGRLEEIPERLDAQIKKSVLDNYDRGRISRDEALEQVIITEY